jgi:CheY-like chemotaxis protein
MKPRTAAGTKRKRLLIVDDEPLVRVMLARVLGSRGVAVFEAENGLEALNFVERNHLRIGAVLSDVRMPLVDGISLARALALTYPDLPVALMSTQFDSSAFGDLRNVKQWLAKPFDTAALVATVGELLGP